MRQTQSHKEPEADSLDVNITKQNKQTNKQKKTPKKAFSIFPKHSVATHGVEN